MYIPCNTVCLSALPGGTPLEVGVVKRDCLTADGGGMSLLLVMGVNGLLKCNHRKQFKYMYRCIVCGLLYTRIFSSDKNFEELNYVFFFSWTYDHMLIKIRTTKRFKGLKLRGSVLSTKISTHRKYPRIRYVT